MDKYIFWFIVSHYNLFDRVYRKQNTTYTFTKPSFEDTFVYIKINRS